MINRFADKQALERIFANHLNRSAILLVCAKTGVGKSYLVDHIFNAKQDISFVRVKINREEAISLNTLYISGLAKALDTYARKTGKFSTIEQFITTDYQIDITKEQVINDVLDITTNFLEIEVIKEKLESDFNTKGELLKKILDSGNDIAVAILFKYILSITSVQKLVIAIENIQFANNKLIDFFLQLLSGSKKLFLIGECTTNNEGEVETELFKSLKDQNLEILELEKLKKDELIGAVKKMVDKDVAEAIIKVLIESYDESHGNLIKFEWLIKKNQSAWKLATPTLSKVKYDDALSLIYSLLTANQRLILWYIVAHQGNVHSMLFIKFTIAKLQIAESDIHETLKLLEEFDLIKIGSTLSVKHDSMFELLRQEDDSIKLFLLANSDWLDFYRTHHLGNKLQLFQECAIFKDDVCIMQIYFILNIGGTLNIDWLNHLLSLINDSIRSVVNPSIIQKLTYIFENLLETTNDNILTNKTYKWIVVIFSKLGYLKEIAKIQEKYKPQRTSDLVKLLQFTARISVCDDAVLKELHQISKTDSDFLQIGCKLLEIKYYRTFNQIKNANKVWKELRSIEKLTPYKYVILEQAKLCSHNPYKRLRYFEEAKIGFEKSSNPYHLCSNLLNITAVYGVMYSSKLTSKSTYLKKTAENLERAKNILNDSHFPMHIYLNQKSIRQLIEGRIDLEIIRDNFHTAYLNCGVEGNKPLIGANIIAVALLQQKYDVADLFVKELMELSRKFSANNSEFARYALVNCYRYFKATGNKTSQDEAIYLFRQGSVFNNFGDVFFNKSYFIRPLFSILKNYQGNIYNWDIDFETIEKQF